MRITCYVDRSAGGFMRIIALLLGAILLPQESRRASLEGVVVSASTGKPIPGVVLELSGVAAGRVRSYTTTTSDSGAFSIRNIPAGNDYALVAHPRPMYLPA